MTQPFDPFAASVREDPYPTYSVLRRAGPVHEMVGGAFVLARHADVRTAMLRPDLFSSAAMKDLVMRADEDPTGPFPETLLGSDPPVHTALRKLVNRGFSRRRIAQLEGRVRGIADGLVAALSARPSEQFDLIADFASPLTVRMISELLGIDPERHEDFRRWSASLIQIISGQIDAEAEEQAWCDKRALGDLIDETLAARRRAPGEDLISDLVRLESQGGPLGPDEVDFLPNLLLIAGTETTTHLIGNLIGTLLRNPTQLELLAARPDWTRNAIEEGLRHDSPIQLVFRRTTRDVEISGARLPAGRTVALLIGSANRDERVFARPDRFDLTRDASRHLTFGLGTHFCLGAPLARLEAQIAIETLATMQLRAAGPPGAWIGSLLVRGRCAIPVARGAQPQASVA